MIIGALFSYDGSFTTTTCDGMLVISTLIHGQRLKRTIEPAELPAFIEYMENNSLFYLDGEIKVELNDIQRGYFLESLKSEAKRMGVPESEDVGYDHYYARTEEDYE